MNDFLFLTESKVPRLELESETFAQCPVIMALELARRKKPHTIHWKFGIPELYSGKHGTCGNSITHSYERFYTIGRY